MESGLSFGHNLRGPASGWNQHRNTGGHSLQDGQAERLGGTKVDEQVRGRNSHIDRGMESLEGHVGVTKPGTFAKCGLVPSGSEDAHWQMPEIGTTVESIQQQVDALVG